MAEFYCNNAFYPVGTPVVSVADRSFRFGDGLFETILVHNGGLWNAEAHWQRLAAGLVFLGIPYDLNALPGLCAEVIARNRLATGYLRIILSRGANGAGAMGYAPDGAATPLLVIEPVARALPAFRSIRLTQVATRLFYRVPCKLNNALPYILALREATAAGADNALMLDAHGTVAETASGNLFWLRGETLYTPSLDLPCVPGTVRAKVLAFWPGPAAEGIYRPDVLAEADAVLMTNVGGLVTEVQEILVPATAATDVGGDPATPARCLWRQSGPHPRVRWLYDRIVEDIHA